MKIGNRKWKSEFMNYATICLCCWWYLSLRQIGLRVKFYSFSHFNTSLLSQSVFPFRVFLTEPLFVYWFIFTSTIEVIDAGGKTLSRGTDRGMAYGKFKAHKFSYLNITNIGSDYVHKGSECGLTCINIPSCFSFNLAVFSDIMNGKILCELLPSDIYNNSVKFVASQFHHHFSIVVSEKINFKKLVIFLYVSFCHPSQSCVVVEPLSMNLSL